MIGNLCSPSNEVLDALLDPGDRVCGEQCGEGFSLSPVELLCLLPGTQWMFYVLFLSGPVRLSGIPTPVMEAA